MVLRRLFVQDDFLKAWNQNGLIEKPRVVAPRAEYFLEHPDRARVDMIIAGGGEFGGTFAALAVVNKGGAPLQVSPDDMPMQHRFTVGEFLQSVGIYVDNMRVSRREVIKYVANKLGGAHLDRSRSGKLSRKFDALDRNRERLRIDGVPSLGGKNAVYFELLSIGQLLGRSEAAAVFRKAAKDFLA